MSALYNLNLFAYHTTEVLICDVKLFFMKAARAQRLKRIAELEAELARRSAK